MVEHTVLEAPWIPSPHTVVWKNTGQFTVMAALKKNPFHVCIIREFKTGSTLFKGTRAYISTGLRWCAHAPACLCDEGELKYPPSVTWPLVKRRGFKMDNRVLFKHIISLFTDSRPVASRWGNLRCVCYQTTMRKIIWRKETAGFMAAARERHHSGRGPDTDTDSTHYHWTDVWKSVWERGPESRPTGKPKPSWPRPYSVTAGGPSIHPQRNARAPRTNRVFSVKRSGIPNISQPGTGWRPQTGSGFTAGCLGRVRILDQHPGSF